MALTHDTTFHIDTMSPQVLVSFVDIPHLRTLTDIRK